MNRKTITIFTILTILVAAITVYGYLVITHQPEEVPGQPRTGFSLFPFGKSAGGPLASSTPDVSGNGSVSDTETPAPLLRKVTNDPVASAVGTTTDGQPFIRYAVRTTGHLYETRADILRAPVRLTNTTFPRLAEVLWNRTADRVIFRYADENGDTIRSFAGILPASATTTGTSSPSALFGSFLRENIPSAAISPELDLVALLRTDQGGSYVSVQDFSGEKETVRFDSPLKEWLLSWSASSTLSVAMKASASAPGIFYAVDLKTGAAKPYLGGTHGLTVLPSPDMRQALYSQAGRAGLFTRIIDLKTGSTSQSPLRTLPEKCVWSRIDQGIAYCAAPESWPSGTLPDAWYQGSLSFEDDIYRLNLLSGTAEKLADLTDLVGSAVDATRLALSPDDHYLLFVSKADSTLWSLSIPLAEDAAGLSAGEE